METRPFENRLQNLTRIETLLSELRSTTPAFTPWRPLLQAVKEIATEFRQHVQGQYHSTIINSELSDTVSVVFEVKVKELSE